jgi:hypothetical protein
VNPQPTTSRPTTAGSGIGLASVAHDVEGLRSAPAISSRIAVSGHGHDVVTGMMRTVTAAGMSPGRS